MPTSLRDPLSLRGRVLRDRDGDKIGKVDEIYFDNETDQPTWALVNTGLFGTKSTFVPIQNATMQSDDDLRVPFEKSHVKDAPNIEADGELSHAEEERLYHHYSMSYGESTKGGRGPRKDKRSGKTDDAMTRSEEELNVGTARRETGRARLRKYVVTENVTKTVPVQREEVRIEREPITDANRDAALSGPDISAEEHEVVLHAEEPVVEKRAVPKERVRLEKDTVTDEEKVSGKVRKERIDVDDDAPSRQRPRKR
jgi:uncharacterized protein (TIGR02271 family)